MEYFIGAIIVLLTVAVTNKLASNKIKTVRDVIKIKYSQSHIYNLVRPFYGDMSIIRPRPSQASDYQKSLFVKVLVVDNMAYWIKNNQLFAAEMSPEGPDQSTAKAVETMDMSKNELDKVMFIVEKLREDNANEAGSAG